MKITKIGYKNQKVTVEGETEQNGEVIITSLTSDIPPLPEFAETLVKIGEYMTKLTGMPDEWSKSTKCYSITIGHEEDERINAIVTLYTQLENFNSGVCINTPVLREKLQGTAGGGKFMPENMLTLVREMIEQAQRYYDGERSQQELPVDQNDDQEELSV